MAISAAEMSRRLKPLLNQERLLSIEEKEIKKNEKVLLQYKKYDFTIGDISGDGVTRLSYRSSEYEEYKFFKNPMAGGDVDLINDGDFIRSFFLQSPLQNQSLFGATDSKAIGLIEKYGDEILGINKDRFRIFLKKYVLDDFRKVLKKQLGQ